MSSDLSIFLFRPVLVQIESVLDEFKADLQRNKQVFTRSSRHLCAPASSVLSSANTKASLVLSSSYRYSFAVVQQLNDGNVCSGKLDQGVQVLAAQVACDGDGGGQCKRLI